MVNHKRIRDKLPELMIDGPLTVKANLLDYKKLEYRLRRMEKTNYLIVTMRVNRIANELRLLEETLDASF
jgi:hypothetical protein